MSLLSPEIKQARLNDLYEYGKSKGIMTYKEIMDRLMELEMDPDQLDHVLETLEAYGVSVVNELPDATGTPADTAGEAEVLYPDKLRNNLKVFHENALRMYRKSADTKPEG